MKKLYVAIPAAMTLIVTITAVVSSCKQRLRDLTSSVATAAVTTTQKTLDVPATVEDCERLDLPGRDVAKLPTAEDLYIDGHCSDLFMKKFDPAGNGVVSVFGSSALKPNNVAYYAIRQLTGAWAQYQIAHIDNPQIDQIPVLTASGPGIMEAANCGVNNVEIITDNNVKNTKRRFGNESIIHSLGYGTTFEGPKDKQGNFLPGTYTGTFTWEHNYCATHGYIFRSFGMRESEMIDRARISIIAPGGVGTEWEIFEIIAKMQTHKAPMIPINNPQPVATKPRLAILLQANSVDPAVSPRPTDEDFKNGTGTPDYRALFAKQQKQLNAYWKPLMQRVNSMYCLNMIKDHDLKLFKCAKSVSEALTFMEINASGKALSDDQGKCEGLLDPAKVKWDQENCMDLAHGDFAQ